MTLGRKSSLFGSLALAAMLLWGHRPLCAFNSSQIRILTNPDLDVIYHTLAHFNLPGDRFNLFSEDYIRRMGQAKRDLEVGATRLDREAAALERRYRQLPRLRFLIRAPFLADDLSSFKQALAMIDYDFRTRTVPAGAKGKRRKEPLMFGNSRRLIPVFRNHFQAPQERAFARQFAGCLEEEHSRFYMFYREARNEWDLQGVEWFTSFWKSRGMSMLEPWASKSGVKQFKVFLTPVMKGRGLGVPVEQDGDVLFHVLAPLPESRQEAIHSFFVVLHETARRSTDALVAFGGPSSSLEPGLPDGAAPGACRPGCRPPLSEGPIPQGPSVLSELLPETSARGGLRGRCPGASLRSTFPSGPGLQKTCGGIRGPAPLTRRGVCYRVLEDSDCQPG